MYSCVLGVTKSTIVLTHPMFVFYSVPPDSFMLGCEYNLRNCVRYLGPPLKFGDPKTKIVDPILHMVCVKISGNLGGSS